MQASRLRSRSPLPLLIGGLLLCLAAGCAREPRRFPLTPPLWEDPDRNPVPERPGKYYSGMIADVADKTVFRKLSQLFTFPLPTDAKNVNALDEVPNSSWFTNRIGMFPMTLEEVARGNCHGPPLDPANGPFVVSAAKPDGANPGFFVKAKTGTYLLKFDGPVQPQRATAADVIGSKIYHAAGFHAPCNQIVYFRSSVIQIAKGATATNQYGKEYALTGRDIDKVLKMGFRLKNGLIRASASKFLPGKPLGPWTYEDTASDDPNDVVPHEDRRELRGARLLAAWLAHTDAREQNTLRVWIDDGGRSYVRHYYLDFGDCFGSRWAWDGISRRLGHSYYFDTEHVLVDFLTLGALPRPWFKARVNREAEIFGYFDSASFDPVNWQVAYPNPAFDRMNYRDALWMVRILARFSDDHVRAAVSAGELLYRHQQEYLTRILIERRDKILGAYLTRYAPLARFRLVRRTPGRLVQSLCSEDLAIEHGLVPPRQVLYKMRFYGGQRLDRELGWLQYQPDPEHPHRSCVVLPLGDRRPADLAPAGAPDDHPLRYGVLKVYIHQKPALPPTSSIWLHFYDLGPKRGFRLVGVDRRPEPVMPDLY
jgi:hypothetical protein